MRNFLVFLIFLATTCHLPISAYDQNDFILVISSYSADHPWSRCIEANIKNELAYKGCLIGINTDYLNSDRFSSPRMWKESMQLILKKDFSIPPKAVVLIADEAWMAYRDIEHNPLQGIPLILCGVKDYSISLDQFLRGSALSLEHFVKTESIVQQYNATGIIESIDVDKNIRLIKRLLPDVKGVSVISDSCFSGVFSHLLIRQAAKLHFPNLNFSYLDGRYITTDSLYSELNVLPKESCILLSSWVSNRGYSNDSHEWIHRKIDYMAQWPIFTLSDWCSPEELFIGGYYAPAKSYASKVVSLIIDVLNGRSPSELPIENNSDNHYFLNWSSMVKLDINTGLAPANTVFFNMPPDFFERYKTIIYWGLAFLFILLSALISTLYLLLRSRKLQRVLNNSKVEMASALADQKKLSEMQWLFLQESTEKAATCKVMEDIIKKFNADLCQIFEFNFSLLSCSCIYEKYSVPVSSKLTVLQDIPCYDLTWLYQKMQNNEELAIDDLDKIWDSLPTYELDLLQLQGVKSIFILPLQMDKKLWGFICMGYRRGIHIWSADEKFYIRSVGHILSMGIKHFRSEILRQESDLKFGYLYKNMSLGVCLFNKDAILSDVNEVFLKLAGVSDKGKLLGKSIYQFQSMPKDALEKLNRGEEVSFEFQLHPSKWNKDSSLMTEHTSVHYFTVHIKVLKNSLNTISGYMMVWVDNTHLVRSQQKVAQIESLFSYASDIANVGVSDWNPITKKGFATEQWFRNFGETTRDITQVIGIYQYVHPEDRVEMIRFIEEASKGKADSFVRSIRVWHDSEWHWLKYHATLKTFDPKKGLVELVCISIDIDNLKKAEEELIAAKAKAEESDKLKSAFIVNMSHEIRTPLNTILGFANILATTENAEERESYGKIISTNSDLLLGLINDILDLSKIETGVLEFANDEIELNDFLREFEHDGSLHIKKQVQIEFVEERGVSCSIKIDRNRLGQVLFNFLSNASKFTNVGYIRYGYKLRSDDLYFYISDTGCGIPKNKFSAIFEPFIKLNNNIQGSGLGLPICQSIIDRFGGKVGLESEEGKGSTFWFTLPLSVLTKKGGQPIPELSAPAVSDTESSTEIDNKPVVLIDDDIQYNYMLIEVLLKKHYRLIHAQNGIEAVALYKQYKPDIILMDIKMPEMDGFEATIKIREISKLVPIIVISAFTFDSDIKRMYDAGCNDYLTKPIDGIQLKALIKKYLSDGLRG